MKIKMPDLPHLTNRDYSYKHRRWCGRSKEDDWLEHIEITVPEDTQIFPAHFAEKLLVLNPTVNVIYLRHGPTDRLRVSFWRSDFKLKP